MYTSIWWYLWVLPVLHRPEVVDIGVNIIQSNLGYPNVNYPKLLGYSKTTDSPDFFLYYLLQ